jgi:all-trans-retinol 13,14-reductase
LFNHASILKWTNTSPPNNVIVKTKLYSGEERWKKLMKRQFPGEDVAIDKYFKLIHGIDGIWYLTYYVKFIPKWLITFFINTGLVNITGFWSGPHSKTMLENVRELTTNKDLQTVFCYLWVDTGVRPGDQHVMVTSQMMQHYHYEGAYYPINGGSEIAFNMIPTIRREGGEVLVHAEVEEILHNGNR